ncbi:MAG: hypothetical protein Q8K92_08845 [Leadbetterella sp.]|nr:hypothetical protein [Leadbetterella sp.]
MISEKNFNEIKSAPPIISSRIELVNTRDIVNVKASLMRKIIAETEENHDAEKIIGSIDFVEFKKVMTDMILDVCPDFPINDINILPLEKTRFYKEYGLIPEGHAQYSSLENVIIVDYYRLKKLFPDSINDKIIHCYFHEQVHAVSKVVCRYGTYESNIVRMGYMYQDGDDELFRMLDEAVTEKMTREIIAKYKEAKQVTASNDHQGAYDESIALLDEVIKKISIKMGVDESAVWKKIQCEKIIGMETGKTGFIDELRKIFSNEFVDNLSRDNLRVALKELEKF